MDTNNTVNGGVMIQSLSVLIPARKFNVDLDFTTKVTVPAILETALKLIACLGELTAVELQQFFGLNDNEREILIEQITQTGFAGWNQLGLLVPTSTMRDLLLVNDGRLLMDDVENHYGTFSVDLLTSAIQPMAIEGPIRGLHILEAAEDTATIDPYKILLDQFPRFQECAKRVAIQSGGSKLYRINCISSDLI